MTQQFEISKKDSLGGLRLENTQLSQWQCPDASIKNLDLWNAPHLTKLDLSLCLPGMHLMLVNCPKITEIILPAGAPCYLHLDSPTSPNLTIQGSIAAFDACWPSQQFRVEAPVEKPWQNASLAEADSLNRVTKQQASELAIIYGQSVKVQQPIKLPATRHLLWLDAKHLSHLEVVAPTQLERLELYNALNLQTITTNHLVEALELRACHNLSSVEGQLSYLQVSNHKGKGSLVIHQAVDFLLLQRADITELIAQDIKRLEVNFCRGLTKVVLPTICDVSCEGPVPLPLRKTARLFINEATVKELLKEYQQGKAQALEDLRPLVVQMVEPVQVPRALKLLNDLLQAGADPEWVWQTRQELSARHLRGRRKANQRNLLLSEQQLQYALKQWRWNLPTDLNENAWLDDWRIWVACFKNPKAQAYAKVMAKRLIEAEIQARKPDVPMRVYLWVRHWLNAGDLQLVPVQKMLEKILKALVKEYKVNHLRMVGFAEDTPLPVQLLKQLTLQLKVLTGDTQPLRQALFDYEYRMLAVSDLLERMQSLIAEDPAAARRHLLHIAAQKPEFWRGRGSKAEIASLPRQARAMAISIGSLQPA